jgi:hypothetical protein
MKTIKYKVGKKEDIGGIPCGSIILNAVMVFGDEYEALIYLPKKVKYEFDGEQNFEVGCSSLSFALFDPFSKAWIRLKEDYLNITLKKYEPRKGK